MEFYELTRKFRPSSFQFYPLSHYIHITNDYYPKSHCCNICESINNHSYNIVTFLISRYLVTDIGIFDFVHLNQPYLQPCFFSILLLFVLQNFSFTWQQGRKLCLCNFVLITVCCNKSSCKISNFALTFKWIFSRICKKYRNINLMFHHSARKHWDLIFGPRCSALCLIRDTQVSLSEAFYVV